MGAHSHGSCRSAAAAMPSVAAPQRLPAAATSGKTRAIGRASMAAADGSIAEAAEIRVHADGNDRAKKPAAAILIAVGWLFLNGQPAYPTHCAAAEICFFKKIRNKGVRG